MTPTKSLLKAIASACLIASSSYAHDLANPDEEHPHYDATLTPTNTISNEATNSAIKRIAPSFAAFKPKVRFYWDEDHFFIESAGIADHPMMIGITAWQQQIPIPQPYFASIINKDTGAPNVWQLPLHPVPAESPLSLKENFFRGAVAIAANGVPIFNPIKNDGKTDTVLAGELDNWGGHGGRGDDYHYHIAPLHLESILGLDKPTAFALDGFPIYGLTEPDGSLVENLDENAGHETEELGYHYHAQEEYPYIQAAFYGEVDLVDDQSDPQPFADRIRDSGLPLPGAEITGFEFIAENEFRLIYRLNNVDYEVNWQLDRENGTVSLQWESPNGTTNETFTDWLPAPATEETILSIGRQAQDLKADIRAQPNRAIEITTSDDLQNWDTSHHMIDETGTLQFEIEYTDQSTFLKTK